MYPAAGSHQRPPGEQSHWHPSANHEERGIYRQAIPTSYPAQEHGQLTYGTMYSEMAPQYGLHDQCGAPQQYMNYEAGADVQPHQQQPQSGAYQWESQSSMASASYQPYYRHAPSADSTDLGKLGSTNSHHTYGEPFTNTSSETGPHYHGGAIQRGANSWYQGEEIKMTAPREVLVGNDFAMAHGGKQVVGIMHPPLAAAPPSTHHSMPSRNAEVEVEVEAESPRIAAILPQFSPNSPNHSPPNLTEALQHFGGQAQPNQSTNARPPTALAHNPAFSTTANMSSPPSILSAPASSASSSAPLLPTQLHHQHPSSSHTHPSLIRRRSHGVDVGLQSLPPPSFGSATAGAHPASASSTSLGLVPPRVAPHDLPPYFPLGSTSSSSSSSRNPTIPQHQSSFNLDHPDSRSAPYPKVEDFDYYASTASKHHPKPTSRVVTQLYGLDSQAPLLQKPSKGLMSRSQGALPLFPLSTEAMPASSTQRPPSIQNVSSSKTGATQFQFHPSPYMAFMDPPLKSASEGSSVLSHSHSSPAFPLYQGLPNPQSSIHTALGTMPNLERAEGDDLDQFTTAKKVKWTESDQSSNHAYMNSNQPLMPQTPNDEDTPDTSSDTASYWTPHT